MEKMSIRIKSVADYLSEIEKLLQEGVSCTGNRYFFRGEEDAEYTQLASLFRIELNDIEKNEHSMLETEMIDTAIQRYPQIFTSCNSFLDKLTLMQHFGMPTRLLDVTSNPLVALYFACKPNKRNGRVYYCFKSTTPLEYVEMLAECIMLPNYRPIKEYYKYLLSNNFFNNISSMLKHRKRYMRLIEDNISKPHLFISSYTNERIRKQEGAFIFSPLAVIATDMSGEYYTHTSTNLRYFFDDEYFEIDESDKASILNELDLCGISEDTLFPDAEHMLKGVKTRCENMINNKWEP